MRMFVVGLGWEVEELGEVRGGGMENGGVSWGGDVRKGAQRQDFY